MPDRPSATGNMSGPAISQPRAALAGFRRTVSRRNEVSRLALVMVENPESGANASSRLLFYI
jgi:hypothetical protein